MPVQCTPGTRLFSTACETEVIVVLGPSEPVELTIGGHEPSPDADRDRGEVEPGADGGSQLGKRYVDGDSTVEILCTRPGIGTIAVAGTPLAVKEAKALPASD